MIVCFCFSKIYSMLIISVLLLAALFVVHIIYVSFFRSCSDAQDMCKAEPRMLHDDTITTQMMTREQRNTDALIGRYHIVETSRR